MDSRTPEDVLQDIRGLTAFRDRKIPDHDVPPFMDEKRRAYLHESKRGHPSPQNRHEGACQQRMLSKSASQGAQTVD